MSNGSKHVAEHARGGNRHHAEPASEIETIAEDIASLKQDLGALMRHAKAVAIDAPEAQVRDMAGRLGEETQHIFSSLAERGEETMKSVERRVEERPFTSLLVAFAVGLLGGRLLGR